MLGVLGILDQPIFIYAYCTYIFFIFDVCSQTGLVAGVSSWEKGVHIVLRVFAKRGEGGMLRFPPLHFTQVLEQDLAQDN